MPKRDQPSSVDRLPEEIRAQIGKLRIQGRTIDEIVAHLKTLDVEISRSALGRHVKGMAILNERIRNSREMAVALVERFGDQPDNKAARLNLELMHSLVLQVITAAGVDEDGEPLPVTFTPEDVMFLSRSLKELASAQKTDSDRTILVQREAIKKAAAAVDAVAKTRPGGMTKDTVTAIKAAILGISK